MFSFYFYRRLNFVHCDTCYGVHQCIKPHCRLQGIEPIQPSSPSLNIHCKSYTDIIGIKSSSQIYSSMRYDIYERPQTFNSQLQSKKTKTRAKHDLIQLIDKSIRFMDDYGGFPRSLLHRQFHYS